MPKKQHGFAHLEIIIVLVVVLVISAVGYTVISKRNATNTSNDATSSMNASNDKDENTNCPANKPGLFTADVTNLEDINLIQNPIRVIGGSNIKTHSYIEVKKRSPVYIPMDATLTGGANYYETMEPNPVSKVQYILSFNDGCAISFWLDHLVDVPDKIKDAFPAKVQDDTKNVEIKPVRLKAGELVGYSNQSGSARFDFGVLNLKGSETSLTTNPKYKDDPIVKTSDKYRFATCPYNFYPTDKLQLYKTLYDPTAINDQEIIDDICQ